MFPQNWVLFHSSIKQRTRPSTPSTSYNKISFCVIGLLSKAFLLILHSIKFLKVSCTPSIKFTSSNLIESGQTFAAATLDKKLYKINHSIFFVCSVTLNPVIHNSLWILSRIQIKGLIWKMPGRELVVLEIQSRKGFWMFSFSTYLWVSKCHTILKFLTSFTEWKWHNNNNVQISLVLPWKPTVYHSVHNSNNFIPHSS